MRSMHLAFVVSAMLCAVLSAQANFDCYALGRFPLPGPPNCENLLCNGLGLSGQTGISGNISCGFPTSGAQYARLDGNGPFAVPIGGPVAYPLPNNVTELRIPIPAGSANVAFCWDFYNAEGFGSSFNDGMAISVVNPTGGLVQALVYADVNNLPGPCTDFFGFGGTEIGQAGPQGFTSTLSPFPAGSYLSICVWNGGDNAVPSHMCLDDVHFNGAPPSCPLPPPPPVNDDCSNATAVVNGSNGPFS